MYVGEIKELREFERDELAHPTVDSGSAGILPARKRNGTLAGRMPALPGMTTRGVPPVFCGRVRKLWEGYGIGVIRKMKECASL